MKLHQNIKIKFPFFIVLSLAFLFTSCGSYQYVGYDSDGIYNNGQVAVTENDVVVSPDDQSVYKDYFTEKSLQYNNVPNDGSAIFTDIDSYEGAYEDGYIEEDTQTGNAGWGSANENVTVNFYDNGWANRGWGGLGVGWYDAYWGMGWNNWGWGLGWNNWGWGLGWNNWGWNAGFGFNNWGWGNNGFWCPPGYGYGFNNFHRGNRGFAYTNGRRGSYLSNNRYTRNTRRSLANNSRRSENSVRSRGNSSYSLRDNRSSILRPRTTRTRTRATVPRTRSNSSSRPTIRRSGSNMSTRSNSSTRSRASSSSRSTRSSSSVRSSGGGSRSSGSRSSGGRRSGGRL